MKECSILKLLLVILLPIFTYSQIEIKGNVEGSNGAIELANIVLINDDNEVVRGTTSNEKGEFMLKIQHGKYRLTISYIGYENYEKNINASYSIDLGDIQLVEDKNILDEVVVSTNKPIIEQKVDRILFNVEGTSYSLGKSSLELLSLTPNVWVSNTGAISLNGVQGVKILINGILLKLSGNQLTSYLNSLNSSQIKRIEVIPDPPAEFDAEGSAGMINIILKREKKDGLNGNIFTSYQQGRFPYFANGFNLNYKNNKIGIYGGYYNIKDKNYSRLQQIRMFHNTNTLMKTSSYSTPKLSNQQVRLGVGIELSDNQYLGAEFVGTFNDKRDPYKNEAEIFNNEVLDSTVLGDFSLHPKNTFYNATVNYDYKIDTLGTNLKIIADYTYNNSLENNNFNSSYYADNSLIKDIIYRNNFDIVTNIYSLFSDFTKVIKNDVLNIGVKYSSTAIDNNILYENFIDESWMKDVGKSNRFRYNENIFASYISYSTRILGIDSKVGLRGEYMDVTGNSLTIDSVSKSTRLDLFPSIFLKYDLNAEKGNSLSFYYGKRINRPSFDNLNPFVFQIDDFSASAGNPNLQPQYNNTLRFGITYRRTKNLSVFYSKVSDVFQQIALNNGDNTVIYEVLNLEHLVNYGASLNYPIQITKWWKSYNNASLYNSEYINNNLRADQLTFQGKTSQNFSISDNLSLELSSGYQSRSIAGNYIMDPTFYTDIGIQKHFINKKLRVMINYSDIFYTRNQDINVISDDLNLYIKERAQTRRILVSLNYNFSLGKKLKIRRTESGNWDEKDRL